MSLKASAAEFADKWVARVASPALEAIADEAQNVTRAGAEGVDEGRLDKLAQLGVDNLPDIFEHAGVDEMTLDEARDAARAYALAKAQPALNARGEMTRGSKLPDNLRDDFKALRKSYGCSPAVRARIMAEHGIEDEAAFDQAGMAADSRSDGNFYINTGEWEDAARSMKHRTEIGIGSDFDRTIWEDDAPVPGVRELLRQLEFGKDGAGRAGDLYIVTARDAPRGVEVPRILAANDLPMGPVETGVGPAPWIAAPEKVRDHSKHFESDPDKRFVLLGDSSHVDPAAYAELLRRYPDRIVAAFIRVARGRIPAHVPEDMFIIENYAQVAGVLFERGVLDEEQARTVMKATQADARSLEVFDISDAEIDALIEAHRPAV